MLLALKHDKDAGEEEVQDDIFQQCGSIRRLRGSDDKGCDGEKNPIRDTYQMNDYAITKWSGELMCMNSTKMYGTETVRVRPVNC